MIKRFVYDVVLREHRLRYLTGYDNSDKIRSRELYKNLRLNAVQGNRNHHLEGVNHDKITAACCTISFLLVSASPLCPTAWKRESNGQLLLSCRLSENRKYRGAFRLEGDFLEGCSSIWDIALQIQPNSKVNRYTADEQKATKTSLHPSWAPGVTPRVSVSSTHPNNHLHSLL